jgi:large subunit ribosomal protein LP2
MKHVAAYLLAVLGGKANPTEADVTAIIAAGGGKADAEQVKKLIAEFAGKTAEQVIAAGKLTAASFGS